MKTVALMLMVAVAAVSSQQPVFRGTASQPSQRFQRQPTPVQQFQPRPVAVQQFQPRPVAVPLIQPQPIQQAYYRRPLPVYRQDVVPILLQKDIRDENGYLYRFEAGDGTVREERGTLKPGPEGSYIVADGSFSYVGTDGVTYTITYKADENGFQPQGAHIPKAPEASSFRKK